MPLVFASCSTLTLVSCSALMLVGVFPAAAEDLPKTALM